MPNARVQENFVFVQPRPPLTTKDIWRFLRWSIKNSCCHKNLKYITKRIVSRMHCFLGSPRKARIMPREHWKREQENCSSCHVMLSKIQSENDSARNRDSPGRNVCKPGSTRADTSSRIFWYMKRLHVPPKDTKKTFNSWANRPKGQHPRRRRLVEDA